jgi:internalin A
MSAAIALTAKLAAPFANMLFKKWLETESGQALAEGVVDIFKDKLSDIRGGERMSRQFQMLGNAIANKLEPIVAGITNQKDAVELVDHLEILIPELAKDTRNLFEISIATDQIVDRWKRRDGNWQMLNIKHPTSPVGKAYDAALHLIAMEFKANLNALPDWQGDATIGILERLDALVAESARGNTDHRHFEELYRHYLAEKCNVMELFGLPPAVSTNTALKAHTTLKLDQSYVTLSLSGTAGGDSVSVALDRASHNGRLRLLVKGEAGCGKTTLMRWIAVRCAQRSLEKISTPQTARITNSRHDQVQPLMDWRMRVPFLIRLRHVDGAGLPDFSRWTIVEGQPLPAAPTGWVDRVLREGRALLLIDGLDEYPEDRRAALLRSVKSHLDLHPDNACLITSRAAAVPPELAECCPVDTAEVMELTPEYRQELIQSWFGALPEHLKVAAGDRMETYAPDLIREIEGRPALIQMAGNPLLCAMFCALKFGTEGELPGNVVKVCADFVDMLLYRRDKDGDLKKEAAPDYARLSSDDRISIARQLAHSMVDAGLSEVTVERARQFIHITVENLSPDQVGDLHTQPQKVLTAMLERSGLLQLAEREKVQFVHNSLKEYLAAKHYAENGTIEKIVAELPKSPWDRVVQFMMGLNLSNGVVATLLKQMLDVVEDDRQPAERRRAVALLAMASASGKGNIPKLTRERLASLCHPFLPPETMEEATLLAQMGDAALPQLLRAANTGRVEQAAATARCLRLIGTSAAKQQLAEHYANHPHRDVAFEVVQCLDPEQCHGFWHWVAGRAFPDFDYESVDEVPLSVAERVRALQPHSCFNGITHLDISGFSYLSDLTFLTGLTSLTHINLVETAVSDISALAALTNLTNLDLSNTAVSDVSALAALTNLTNLYLSNTAVSDVSALAALTNLTNLYLSNTAVSDVSALAALTNLTNLDLSNTAVSDVSTLAALTNLTNLFLSNAAVSDVNALAALTNLTELSLFNTTVSDVSALAALTKLTNLDLSNTAVSDVSALAALTKLTNLYLHYTVLSDVSALAALTNLTNLYLSNTAVSDVSALAALTNLTELSLFNTTVSDVSALAALTKLTNLYLFNTAVSDVSALATLTNLTKLYLFNTAVSDVSALAALTNLTSLYLSNTAVSDVSALAALTNLTNLSLLNTAVSDVSAFKNNKKLMIIGNQPSRQ